MKKAIVYILLGICVLVGGLMHNEHRLIPEFLYYVFAGIAIVMGIYKMLTSETEETNE